MRSANPALISLLNSSQQFIFCDLYEITLANSTKLRYSTLDVDVTYKGNVYLANAVILDRGRTRAVIGVEVDTLEVEVNPHPSDYINGISFVSAAASGSLDGASILLSRAFFDENLALVDGFVVFAGAIADIEVRRSKVAMQCKSNLELLNISLPKNVYQSGCQNTLYDENCTLSRAAWATAATVNNATRVTINATIAKPAKWFDQGYIQFTSGTLNGIKRTVKSWDGATLTLLNGLPSIPAFGDTFNAYAGCDKKLRTCGAVSSEFTVNTSSNIVTSKTGYSPASGEMVKVSSTSSLPAPLVAGTPYYVIKPIDGATWISGKTYRLSTSLDGPAIDITTAGSGVHSIYTTAKFNNAANFRAFPFVPVPESGR